MKFMGTLAQGQLLDGVLAFIIVIVSYLVNNSCKPPICNNWFFHKDPVNQYPHEPISLALISIDAISREMFDSNDKAFWRAQ